MVKNPQAKLEELRRRSLVEYEHLKSAGNQRGLSRRDMPEHASQPIKTENPISEEGQQQLPEKEPSYFSGPESAPGAAAKIPGGEDDQPQLKVQPEKPGQEEEDNNDDISPTATLSQPISSTTAAAELSGSATRSGAPVFAEPDFGVDTVGPVRSAGSFSAACALEAQNQNLSPTKR
jgi:hypothetical protein